MKLLFVFGTRPEAIKMAPVIKKFLTDRSFESRICVTGQHREMLDQVLDFFEIKPDYDLDIMKSSQNLFDITSKVMIGLGNIFEQFKPDIVFVHGDTTTALSSSLATFYGKIKLAHIEAGLRTNNLSSPWPEEGNRQVISVLSNFHFAPTEESKQNLIKEGKSKDNIILTGNTVIDSLLFSLDKIKNSQYLIEKIQTQIQKHGYRIKPEKRIILVTGHRRENFGEGFLSICDALQEIAKNNPSVDIVYPVHLNPNVQVPVREKLSNTENIFLIPPLSYEEFVYMMSISYLIITDSGGVQEEAPSLGKPVLVMRDTTERPEALKAGTVRLVGTVKDKIVFETEKLLINPMEYNKMSLSHNPYGDGKASVKILQYIKSLNL